MAESTVAVTPGAGKNLHTYSRVISATTVEDEAVIPGEYPLASYTVSAEAVVTATANSHLLQIMAGASLNVRIRRIIVWEAAPPAAITALTLQVFRLTTAGTGGTALTPAKMDTGDAAAGATAMTLPTVKGTESTQIQTNVAWFGTNAIPLKQPMVEWIQHPGMKPIIIPAGAANGIAIKNPAALATATVYIYVELVETSFL